MKPLKETKTMNNRYTKFILTVIAIFLGIIAFRDVPIIPTVHAQNQRQAPVPVNIVQIDGQTFGTLQVSSLRPALPIKVAE